MSRNARTLLVVGIGLVAAIVSSFLVYRTIKQIPIREVEVAHLFQVIAARPLAMGDRVTKADVKLVAWPASSPVPKGFSTLESVLNRGVVTPVGANEPLTESNVASPEAGTGLPPSIPPGMRAISVKVNEVIGVAGFVVPGTRVDVMVLLKRGTESIARVVVSNAQVLTAGTRSDQQRVSDGPAAPSTVVTLLVTPEDASRIGLASSDGQIMLTLRNPTDDASTTSTMVRGSSLSGETTTEHTEAPAAKGEARHEHPRKAPVVAAVAPPPPPATPAAAPLAATPSYKVETIRAAKRTEETLRTEETAR